LEVILEVRVGPLVGKTITVANGKSALIGRAAERVEFAVPHDNQMSGVHFAVECGPNGSRLIDKKSTNGTYLNGTKVKEQMLLANGDEIKSGQTIFVVRIVPDNPLPAVSSSPQLQARRPTAAPVELRRASPPQVRPGAAPIPSSALQDRPSKLPPSPSLPQPTFGSASPPRPSQLPALAIGGWAFQNIPDGWKIQEGLGIQQVVKDAFPSSIGAMEEPLGHGLTLQHYVDAHAKMFREYLPKPKIDVAVPPAISGAVEAVALEVRYSTKDGPLVFYGRTYARSGSILGVLTLTTLEKDLPSVRPIYDSVLSAISFSSKN
jgi:hypothetical protein